MARAPEKSVANPVLEIVGTALICTLVISLVWFLIEVFYRGELGARLCWILGLFSAASVLVSRISIEVGRERAWLFAVPLAGATFLVCLLLVKGGPLFPVLMVAFVALVMWLSDRLTWDVTVIDSSRDPSGVGLVELGRRALSRQPKSPHDPTQHPTADVTTQSSESTGKTQAADAPADTRTKARPSGRIWNLVFGPRQRNTPGLWTLGFSLAGLLVFSVGQMFVRPDGSWGYLWVSILFAVFVASALALLAVTSLFGLQRYLALRKLELPDDLIRRWLTVGLSAAALAALTTALVPRPNVPGLFADRIASLVSRPRDPSSLAFGKDGTQSGPQPRSSTDQQSGEGPTADGKSQQSGGQTGNQNKPGGNQPGGKSGSGPSQPGQRDSNQPSSSPSAKDSDSSSQSQSQPQGKQPDSQSRSVAENRGDQSQPNDSGAKQPPSDSAKSDSEQNPKSDPASKDNSSSSSRKDPAEKSAPPENSGSAKPGEPSEAQKPQQRESKDRKDKSGSSSSPRSSESPANRDPNADRSANRSPSASPPSASSPQFLSDSSVSQAVRWFFILAGLAALVIAAWLFRAELAKLWKELRAWLDGEKSQPTTAASSSATASGQRETRRAFSECPNPFRDGRAKKLAPVELIRETFIAMETLAGEAGFPRDPESTPHEFAGQLAAAIPGLAASSRSLAELYARAAYGSAQPVPAEVRDLGQLWNAMEAFAATSLSATIQARRGSV